MTEPKSYVAVRGFGAVSPAGWGSDALDRALTDGTPVVATEIGGDPSALVRRVPAPGQRPDWWRHPRLRRASPISRFLVGAVMEALDRASASRPDASIAPHRLGVVTSVMNACVHYSARFYAEVLEDPATASPILFPETVFNAPSSHLSAFLGASGPNDTIVGDAAQFGTALEVAAGWLEAGDVDRCLVACAEECDWLSADGLRLFERGSIAAEGAAAIVLERADRPPPLELAAITERFPAFDRAARRRAAADVRQALDPPGFPSSDALLATAPPPDSTIARDESAAWSGWTGPRMGIGRVVGDALGASAGLQCVAALAAITRGAASDALVPMTGANQQAVGVRFRARRSPVATGRVP